MFLQELPGRTVELLPEDSVEIGEAVEAAHVAYIKDLMLSLQQQAGGMIQSLGVDELCRRHAEVFTEFPRQVLLGYASQLDHRVKSGNKVLRFAHFCQERGQPDGQNIGFLAVFKEAVKQFRENRKEIGAPLLAMGFLPDHIQLVFCFSERGPFQDDAGWKLRVSEEAPVNAQIGQRTFDQTAIDSAGDQVDVVVVHKLIAVHIIRADEHKGALRQQLIGSVDSVDGFALADVEEFVVIVGMQRVCLTDTELLQIAHLA